MKRSLVIAFVLANTALSVPARAAADAPFLTDAIKGDNSEVALGELAQQRGASAATRAYGAMLVHDHGAHSRKIAALDNQLGIAPTTALSDDGAHAKAMLRDIPGEQFDMAFKQHMIADHTQDIAKYEAAARSAHSPRVRELATQTLPTLRKHLEAAKAL